MAVMLLLLLALVDVSVLSAAAVETPTHTDSSPDMNFEITDRADETGPSVQIGPSVSRVSVYVYDAPELDGSELIDCARRRVYLLGRTSEWTWRKTWGRFGCIARFSSIPGASWTRTRLTCSTSRCTLFSGTGSILVVHCPLPSFGGLDLNRKRRGVVAACVTNSLRSTIYQASYIMRP